ncbi:MAG: hypothetical protein A3H27_10535 [Acidobacteria bacterium RIFCSPLOWO2_02_FULL_59_13]|nr:MAG: hypothetical protein A3H27_10535 [Acidobacteria bacterium RIFCSPLOWO2_02_FULL_59_13]
MPLTHSPEETGRANPPVLLVAVDDDPQCLALIEESLAHEDLSAALRECSVEVDKPCDSPVKAPDSLMSLEELQRSHSLLVLASANGNQARAAGTLGIGRATLYRLLSDAHLKSPKGSEASAPSATQLSRNLRSMQP